MKSFAYTLAGYDGLIVYKDDNERLNFLTTLTSRVDKPASQDAYVFALTSVASVRLRLGQTAEARKDLDKCEGILDTFDNVETVVHASFYRVSADYYQSEQEFASYYRTTLLYLACVEVEDLNQEDRQRIAYDLAIAALVSGVPVFAPADLSTGKFPRPRGLRGPSSAAAGRHPRSGGRPLLAR